MTTKVLVKIATWQKMTDFLENGQSSGHFASATGPIDAASQDDAIDAKKCGNGWFNFERGHEHMDIILVAENQAS